jgi:hypothetical protein
MIVTEIGTLFPLAVVEFKQITMSDLLYFVAIILLIGWILGVFVFSLGTFIHFLLVFAVIAILFRLISGRSV